MIAVTFYGHLREKFGHKLRLEVSSVSELMRALHANFKEFRATILMEEFYVILKDEKDSIEESQINDSMDCETLHVIPKTHGAAEGFFSVIFGGALALAGLAIGMPFLVKFGVATALSGIAAALFGPQQDSGPGEEQEPSFAFNGTVNTTKAGNAIQLFYGEGFVGSQIISANITAEDIPEASS